MYILSGAVAFSKNRIPSEELLKRKIPLESKFVESRCSVLSSDEYCDLRGKSRFAAAHSSTPTTLGIEALGTACETLGIAVSEIGLVIADCSTPRQTIPAESQRIAGALGLKVPAFDILSPIVAPILHAKLLTDWKDELLPDYIGLVYTNTPTIEAFQSSKSTHVSQYDYGDGATALIVSKKIARGLLVEATSIAQVQEYTPLFPVYAHDVEHLPAVTDPAVFEERVKEFTGKTICFASPSIELQHIATRYADSPVLTGGVSQSGYALSTSVAATLLEAISFGDTFGLIANFGRTIATAHIRRV